MSVKLSHIALACPQIKDIEAKLRELSLEVEKTHEVPTEKVRAGMVPVGFSKNFRIELLEPTSPDSPISKFLAKRPDGGIHHICFEVTDLEKWEMQLKGKGFEILPPGIRKAARGKAFFVHPKSFGGVLVELEEITHA
jgi:methylmalonyl-CoA/ethylmalonyl-CoA epimerase